MPMIVFDEVDLGPPELAEQLPLQAELIRVLPGDDRPDYALVRPVQPVVYIPGPGFDPARADASLLSILPDGREAFSVVGLIICARLVGTQLSPTMRDLWVNVAYVIDTTQLRDERVDFAKNLPAAIARINLTGDPRS